MTANTTWLHLPIEWYHREWQSKLVLACVAAARGYSVMIGNQKAFQNNIHRLPGGVYLRKSFTYAQRDEIAELNSNGIRSIGCDEEYFGFYGSNNESTIERRTDPVSISNLAAVFVWGRKLREIIVSKYPDVEKEIFITGSPRFDLYREGIREIHRREADNYRKKFGKFILINSNFGPIASVASFEEYVKYLGFRRKSTPKELLDWERARFEFKSNTMARYFAVLPLLRKAFPDYAIVVRPHPTESRAHWEEAAEGIDRCHVIHEGHIGPWLLAADAMVHNGCSTAVESYFLGKRAIAYYPIHPGDFEEIGGKVSYTVRDEKELLDKIEDVSGRAAGDDHFDAVFEEYFLGLRGPLGSQRTVDAIDELVSNGRITPGNAENTYESARPWGNETGLKRVRKMTRSWRYRYFSKRWRSYFPTPESSKLSRKWPVEESVMTVQQSVDWFCAAADISCELRVRELDMNLFSIRAA